jgi:Raf kinase inhibitor-like YbhB/YbcL family protein
MEGIAVMKVHFRVNLVITLTLIGLGCQSNVPDPAEGVPTMNMQLSSSAFSEGQSIPAKYTGDGSDASPPFAWSEPPAGTKSFALICEDPDAPLGTWTHWVLFNLSPQLRKLDEGVPTDGTLPNGAIQGKNDFKKIGYGGPAPPKGKPHRYFFKLYALDSQLSLEPGASRKQLLAAMKGHVLAEGQMMGKYQR